MHYHIRYNQHQGYKKRQAGDGANDIFAVVGDTVAGRIDNDQTGALPLVSSQGNHYVFILYN